MNKSNKFILSYSMSRQYKFRLLKPVSVRQLLHFSKQNNLAKLNRTFIKDSHDPRGLLITNAIVNTK